MERSQEVGLSNSSCPFSKELVEQLIELGNSDAVTKALLFKDGRVFSGEAVQNLTIALSVFRMLKLPIPSTFFIYGSTARGSTKAGERIQEFRFWQEGIFLGSCFRRRGESDIDLRIIAQDYENILPSLEVAKQNLRLLKPVKIDVKIDDPAYVEREIRRTDDYSSFFRIVLALDQPLVLSGRGEFENFRNLARSYLTAEDYADEAQRMERKLLVLRETAEKPFLFWTGDQLQEAFPSYYSSFNLRAHHLKGVSSPVKVTLSAGESSLITVSVNSPVALERFMSNLFDAPDVSARELIENLTEDGLTKV